MLTLGIDPGTTRVGYGLVESHGEKLVRVESGLLPIPLTSSLERLRAIDVSCRELIFRTRPDRVGVERIFFSKNQKTAMDVAKACGVILNAVAASGCPLFELNPLEVKVAVTGDGGADKRAVAKMVVALLHLTTTPKLDDETDALAVAIAASSLMLPAPPFPQKKN